MHTKDYMTLIILAVITALLPCASSLYHHIITTHTVILEPPSLYLLIQEPLSVLERIDNVKNSMFVGCILDSKSDERIVSDYPLCQHCQLKEIFRDWLQGRGKTPVTWSTLIDTLRCGGLHTLADDIDAHVSRNALFLHARPDAHWDPKVYSEAAQTLRQRYIDQNVYTSSIPFVDISLKNMTTGVPLLKSVFILNLDKHYRLSIAGQAGAGKTTLLWHIAKEWANHRVLQSTCDILFLVELEHLPKSKSYTSLEELFEGLGYQKLNIKQLASEIDTRRGSKACFLIDDFVTTYSPGNTNFINDLINDLLPLSHIIFTSEPYITKKSDRIEYVEVLGYKDEDLEKHLNTLCKDEEVRKSMLTLWEEQPTVREMCLLPLHLVMVIDLVKHDTKSNKDSEIKLHGNELKIQTRTDIYLSFMNRKLEHFKCFNVKQSILKKWNDHDPPCKNLNILLKVAFDMVFTGQNTFDYDPNIQNSLAKIGLVTITEINTTVRGRTQVLYIFTHPTYREFLAAIYIATLPLDIQLAYITMYGKDVAFSNVWLFYFGLLYEYGYETDIPVLLKRYSSHYSYQLPAAGIKVCDFEFETLLLAVVREIYRADRNQRHKGFISTLLKEAGIVVNSSLCLRHSSSYEIKDEEFFERLFRQINKFQLSLGLIINMSMEVVSFMLEDHSHSHHLQKEYHKLVTCVRYKRECKDIHGVTAIQGNPQFIIHIIGATEYVHQLTPSEPHNLTLIILESDNDEMGLDRDVLQYIQHSASLRYLKMSLSCRHFPALYYELFSNVNKLYLELRNCGKHTLTMLPTDALRNLQGVLLISPHHEINLTGQNNLQFLHLIEISIHTANIDQWVKYFNGNIHLKTLEISISDISESVVEKLFNNLPQHLENLILEENVFSDHVLGSLSKALTRLSDLRSLSLSNNLIKGSSLQMLAKVLSSLQHFQSLDLSYSSSMRICDEGIEALAQVKSLETLNIKGCRIPVRMKNSLVKVIKNLPKLKSLHFRIARVPQPLDLLYLDVTKSLDKLLQSQRGTQSLPQLNDLYEDPMRLRAALKELSDYAKMMLKFPIVDIFINQLVLPASKFYMGLLDIDDSFIFSNEKISVSIPMDDIKELYNGTLDLLSNMTVRDTVSENLHFMHHYKFTRVRNNPVSVTLLNKVSYLLKKLLHTINKMLGTKVHRSHEFMSILKLISYYAEEMTQTDYYIPNENEMYDQILNHWYERFEGFDVNDDFNNHYFWTSQDILNLSKEMSSMKELQNLQVEFV